MLDETSMETDAVSDFDYQIRAVKADDLEQLALLQLRVFPRKRQLDELIRYFEWKYLRNPVGKFFGVVAELKDGSIVGSYIGIPIRVRVHKQTVIGYMIASSSVDENHRGRGLFKAMYIDFKNLALPNDLSPWIFGFPNPSAFAVGKRYLDYTQLLRIYTYLIPIHHLKGQKTNRKRSFFSTLRTFAARKRYYPDFSRNRSPAELTNKTSSRKLPLEITEEPEIPRNYSDFWNKVSSCYQNLVIRDPIYLNWRFFHEPDKSYKFFAIRQDQELIGYFVVEFAEETKLVDFLCLPNQQLLRDVFDAMLEVITPLSKPNFIRFPIYDFQLELLMTKYKARVVDLSAFAIVAPCGVDDALRSHLFDSSAWFLNGNEYFIG